MVLFFDYGVQINTIRCAQQCHKLNNQAGGRYVDGGMLFVFVNARHLRRGLRPCHNHGTAKPPMSDLIGSTTLDL